MKYLDSFFTPNYYITLFLSGFIGIFIYVAKAGDAFVDQNKFYYIATGFPIWFLIRYIYWKLRDTKDIQSIEFKNLESASKFTETNTIKKTNVDEQLLQEFYNTDPNIVNKVVDRILEDIKEEKLDRTNWSRRILNRKSIETLNGKNRMKAFEIFSSSANTFEEFQELYEAFEWVPEKNIQSEIVVLRNILWPNKTQLRNTETKNNQKQEDSLGAKPRPDLNSRAVTDSSPKTVVSIDSSNTMNVMKVVPTTSLHQSIRDVCHRRGIISVYHFTAIRNLKGIMKKGVLSNLEIKQSDIYHLVTDVNRNDGILDGTCWSISHPNSYYFKRVQEKFPDEKWCLLEVPAEILWTKDCIFNQTNAANKNQSSKTISERATAEAFESLFNSTILGKDNAIRIRKDNELRCNPTDTQAEVIIRDKVEPEMIKKIHVYDFEDVKLVCNEIVTENVSVQITKKLFQHRI